MVYDYFDKYTFLCDMYDEDADEVLELILNFFPSDNSVQVINSKRGKTLLKRSSLPTLNVNALQIGNVVNIFSKLLHIVDCAPITKRTLFKNSESLFVMIKPIKPSELGKIFTFILKKGFRIVRMKNCRINKEFAKELYRDISGSNFLPIVIDYVTSGNVVGMELVKSNAVEDFRASLGAADPSKAAPGTLRALYGENTLRNCAHACKSVESSQMAMNSSIYKALSNLKDMRDSMKGNDSFSLSLHHRIDLRILELFFGNENGMPRFPYQATFENCTCCIIKPHSLIDGTVGSIVEHIAVSENFYISAMAIFSVKVSTALEFYEVYKDVVPDYEAMAIQLAEGKCIALEVKSRDPNIDVVAEFRKMCGPRDPDIARQLYPDTIRALYGKNIIQNAVHCTSLSEDGVDEVEYFFKLLACQQQ